MKVHTGRGDDGTTGLFYGGRVRKDAPGPEAYGTVDETVAALGVARAEAAADPELAALILALQRELFVVGAELATAAENASKLVDGESRVSAAMTAALAELVESYESRLPELREFVVPGANRLAAALDLARTVCRRAERAAITAQAGTPSPNPELLRYLNLLSDLLFLLARDAEEVLTTVQDHDA
ncbi:MAG: cob(I)yrinic acid a,c-diamide adenosyltransferase [Acidimicrobiia bacterium]|nr:cob(I)yrinic acid a,c-diamide adenosyltransferase [Acidimicrobiia bacterium]